MTTVTGNESCLMKKLFDQHKVKLTLEGKTKARGILFTLNNKTMYNLLHIMPRSNYQFTVVKHVARRHLQ